ncbi:hypothetical protein CC1G_04675 [Coprinopsis cinerea okayama7|uniref:BTB domain-containing protein n=1 Tax=Coprinopsis cinerea (strain Okayama-7 / 130 / ATCC MYA-4618 / FGSC 9003) TaxID=240176 RepID=A8N4X5_COPC7|nr:hypothetical protein CC1G_04675 [Coprinopsis cinerea okayama7\|eukprot:XP_001829986.2 hypothetical protein CC1G_04675 [Coprinopsis cinerea okayama7\
MDTSAPDAGLGQDPPPTKNALYFLRIVVFKAENELFQVPVLYFMSESQFFRDMFKLPPPEGAPVDGSSEDHPIVLEGIRALEFQALLKVMFTQKKEELGTEEWEGVLKLSDMWEMHRFKSLAVKNLGSWVSAQDPVSRILLGRKYNVDDWQGGAYAELVRREEPISLDDLSALGADAALKICSLRERCHPVKTITKVIQEYVYHPNRPPTSETETEACEWTLQARRQEVPGKELIDLEEQVGVIFGIRMPLHRGPYICAGYTVNV